MAAQRKNRQWSRLDNAAKIFPPTSDKDDPKVFRFSCELYEKVKSEALQEALEMTLEFFKGYLSVIRHGFFWYYLEATDLRPVVHLEDEQLCAPLYDANDHTLLFDVSYFGSRINLEIYHALSDGTGALHFLKSIVCNYLSIVHKDKLGSELPKSDYDGSFTEQTADSFQKYYSPENKKIMRDPPAYKVHGPRLSNNQLRVIEGIIPLDKALKLSKKNGATLTVFLTALFMKSIAEGMSVREKNKPVTIAVPVNLRQFFESETTRNFFAVTSVSYNFSKEDGSLEDIMKSVAAQFEKNLQKDSLLERFGTNVSLETNVAVRLVPLVIKDFFLKAAYNINERSVTAALSNVGKVSVPEVYEEYIKLFDVFTSTKKQQICMCSFKNNLVISFTDHFVSADVQKRFFRYLAKEGLEVEIRTNPIDERRVKYD